MESLVVPLRALVITLLISIQNNPIHKTLWVFIKFFLMSNQMIGWKIISNIVKMTGTILKDLNQCFCIIILHTLFCHTLNFGGHPLHILRR